ncbi:hypothetical protein CRE_07737 [Caenorhabditis remanei]|uniref:Serpentine receptor class r-10 n=1 Tax=Caenorhabditis remanei TaxID=31234 RepID=E3MZY4_CAERE|nr:hypothetical protein CRE_07737 [Caenorhabditis remanei]
MCSTIWLEVTVYAEIIAFVLSVTLNLILQCLIYEMSKKTFGNYKYLMFSFSVLGIYYSCCDYWSKPNVHISEVSFAIFNVRKVTGFNKYLGVTALSIYCGCYGMMLVLLTTHFYYRFLSVTIPSKLSRFAVRNFPIWALLGLMSYLIWFGLTYFVNGSSSMKDQVLIPEFERDYCMQPDEFSYVGIQYYYTDRLTGETKMHIPSLFSSGVYACFMTLTSGFMTYFGVKTYAHLNKLTTMTSLDFRELQNQLFRTLVIQTLIPWVFMYLPVFCTFSFPLFGLTSESLRNFLPISVALYLCFEPLVAMYFIKIFRKRIIGIQDFLGSKLLIVDFQKL